MENSTFTDHKKHGLILMIVSQFVLVSLLLLSQGWYEGYTFFKNISEIYLFRVEDSGYSGFGRRYEEIHTKYFLVATLAFLAYGIAIYLEAISTPIPILRNFFKEDEQDSDRET